MTLHLSSRRVTRPTHLDAGRGLWDRPQTATRFAFVNCLRSVQRYKSASALSLKEANMPGRRLLGRPDPDQVMVDLELELEVDGPVRVGRLPDEHIDDSDPETHWGLDKQTSE